MYKILLLLALASGFTATPAYPQTGKGRAAAKTLGSEEWAGVRTAGDRTQTLVLHLASSNSVSSTVDLPEFGALGIPASRLSLVQDHIHFELDGDSTTAVFDGSLNAATIKGHWTEGAHAGDFTLTRLRHSDDALLNRELSVQNGNVRLSGTLLVPKSTGPFPIIVFIQGSGPETRHASLFLARYFVARGVGAFIYDKRGSGASTGDWKRSSFEDLASDVVAVVTALRTQSEVDPSRIGLMGSSQGGWVAPMAALHLPNTAFVIVKSAAAVTPEQQELARVETSMNEQGASSAELVEGLNLYRNAIAYARSGVGWGALQQEIKADATKPWAMFEADTPSDFYLFEQIRLFFAHEPLPVIEQLRSPLLVIYGGKDDDGPPVQTEVGPLLAAMQANRKPTQLAIFPDAGHDLRVSAGSAEAWDFAKFAPGYLNLLGTWVSNAIKSRQALP